MKISTIQTSLYWESTDKNLSHLEILLDTITESTDLIVLPEMFTTGFTMNPEKMAEAANGETLSWMLRKAKEKNSVLCGSVSVKEKNGKYYNRLYWAQPDGNFQYYDKRHLFRMGGEEQHYSFGDKKIITKLKGWQICPLICYDLRFPVWSRNKWSNESKKATAKPEYDVLIYVANWPASRAYAWKQLLIARAIENQCYVIGVNRIGLDGNNYDHSGDSMVINPRGEIFSQTKANEERIETLELDENYLREYRKLFPVGLDADDFRLI
jgi:omega-amidase